MNWNDEVELVEEESPAAPDFGPDPADEAASESADEWFADDPLASQAPLAPEPSEEELAVVEADEKDEDWGPEKGFPDRTNAVRIWVDDEGLPTRVRVSLSWREKLRSGSLGEAVTQAFMLINHFHHIYGKNSPTRTVAQPSEPLDDVERAELVARIDDLAAQLGTRTPGSYRTAVETWEPAIGTDFQDGVLVQLDATGRPAHAKFDPKWLATANSRELATGILTAFRRARDNYRPPEVKLTHEGELLQQLNELTARLLNAPVTL